MKKLSKKVKGMTLVEVIVALAVFAVMGVLVCTAVGSITAHRRAANDLNEKVSLQSPIAEVQDTSHASLMDAAVTIRVSFPGSAPGTVINQPVYGESYSVVLPDCGGPAATCPGCLVHAPEIRGGKLSFKFVAGLSSTPVTP